MRRQAKTTLKLPKKAPPTKKDELLSVIRQRDALWDLLRDVDTSSNPGLAKKRFDIYTPPG